MAAAGEPKVAQEAPLVGSHALATPSFNTVRSTESSNHASEGAFAVLSWPGWPPPLRWQCALCRARQPAVRGRTCQLCALHPATGCQQLCAARPEHSRVWGRQPRLFRACSARGQRVVAYPVCWVLAAGRSSPGGASTPARSGTKPAAELKATAQVASQQHKCAKPSHGNAAGWPRLTTDACFPRPHRAPAVA